MNVKQNNYKTLDLFRQIHYFNKFLDIPIEKSKEEE